mmetsp:Transcript_1736/g.4445  ORF Transcript_1736/g.4445 Transcript_1736/m.4445 type:complete len:466 (+) Transcript_1736:43-1440(+)
MSSDGGAAANGHDMESSRRALDMFLGSMLALGAGMLVAAGRDFSPHLKMTLCVNVLLSAVGFRTTTKLIYGMGDTFVKAGLKGIDLNKHTTKRDAAGMLVRPIEGISIPESQGTVCSAVFVLVMSVFIPFAFAFHKEEVAIAHLLEYLSAVLTITVAAFLGFADDVLDLKWREKIPLPFLATLPLVLVYHVTGKQTAVMVPNMLQPWLGDHLELGILFYIFLLCMTVSSTHAINIYAGVNGLEVGQSVIIALSVLVLNVLQLHRIPLEFEEYREQHMQSLFHVMPFLGVSLALWRLNWWPAKVFVGDTYCYFAGMSLATMSIVGHFSKTLVLFLIPQAFNCIYSAPQLFRRIGIPQPRHRMPTFNPATGFVQNSFTEFKPSELPVPGRVVYEVLRTLRLAKVLPPDEDGKVKMSNLTLINLILYWGGPCREDVLCIRLLALQVLSSLFCFAVRFGLASYLFDVVL